MSNLTILNKAIRQSENLFSLNDLHRASGSESKHQPAFFARLETTQALVAEIQNQEPTAQPIKSINGGTNRGTYACKEIVIAYAAWISPQFHLVVLRAFLDQLEQQPKQLALPEPEPEKSVVVDITAGEVHSLVWLLLSHRNMNALLGELEKPLRAIGSTFAPTVYSHHHEYKYLIKTCNPLLKRLIEPFKKTNRMEYERIKHRLDLEPEKLLSR